MAYLGDAGIEFLVNDFAKGGRVYLRRKRYSSRYFAEVLREFTTTGYIDRVTKKGVSHIRLTPLAKTRLRNDIPLPYLQQQKWDGYFRGISYDFPEKIAHRRNQLREQIRSWGMGKFHRSLWITPHPLEVAIDDFIASRALGKYAFRFTSKKLSSAQGKDIAYTVWQVEKLEEAYEEFAGKWEDKLVDEKLKPSDLVKMRSAYFSLIEQDPHLPFALLPPGWPAAEAKSVYLTIEAHLANN